MKQANKQTNQQAIKAAIFDLDGTLLDSMHVWGEVDAAFLSKRGIAVPDDYMQAMSVLHFEEAAHYTIRRFGLNERPEDIMDEWNRLAEEAYATRVALKPGAEAFLRRLYADGLLLGVATALPPQLYTACLTHLGVYSLFSAFASNDEVGCSKERPDVYLLAAERLGVLPRECVVFEDILPGICSAKGAGMRTVGVRDAYAAHAEADIRAAADWFIESFEEYKTSLFPAISGK